MKKLIVTKIILILITGFWGCQSTRVFNKKNDPQRSENELEKAKQSELDEILTLKELGDRSFTMNDTLGADFYYGRAVSQTDSLSRRYPSDSTLISLSQSIHERYDSFLSKTTSSTDDSLSPGNILEEINMLAQEGDSTLTDTVNIADVIDKSHQMQIPLVLNRKVEQSISYFTNGRGRRVFSVWLKRAGRYEILVKKVLREEGVPEELFYLAMIESGLRPYARSWARAVGMWQFIAGTGRMYGLRYSWWFDERRDPVKATRAAAQHLKDLYERFGDWYLAMAGYNFSPRKIERRLAKYGVEDFWDLPRLPRETRNYIPTFIAAATIAQNPQKYGFNIDPQPPLVFDTVTVRECVDLNVVAQCVNTTFAEIKELNPALVRWCTPPDRKTWLLNLPAGSRQSFVENYAKIPDNKKLSYVHHRIRSGETLSTIARKYGVSMYEIKRFNKIRGSLIRAGHSLVIPVPQNKTYYKKYAGSSSTRRTYSRAKVKNVPGREKKEYIVKRGDTLWDVSRAYNVTVSQIRKWNGLGYSRIIRPGQKLNIWVKPGAKTDNDLLASNTSKQAARQQTTPQESSNTTAIIHTVRPGDTLWDISLQYNVSIRNIKKWNGKRSNVIKPGEKLKIFR